LGLSYCLSKSFIVYPIFLIFIPCIHHPIKNEKTQQIKQGNPKKYVHLFIAIVEKLKHIALSCLYSPLVNKIKNKIKMISRPRKGRRRKRKKKIGWAN